MFGMIGVMAEFEKSLSVERVRAGMRNAKLKGVPVGRPTKPIRHEGSQRTACEG